MTEDSFMEMPFVRSYEEVEYDSQHASLMTQLQANGVVLESVTIDLWAVGSDLQEEWFVESQAYWTKDIDFKIRFRQH